MPFKWLERGPFLTIDSETIMLLFDDSDDELRGPAVVMDLIVAADDANGDLDCDVAILRPFGG